MTCPPFCSQCGGHLGHAQNGDETCQKCKDKNMTKGKDKAMLLELAARCEQATGPDRELDVDITCAAYKWLREGDHILPAPSGGGRCVHYYASGTHGTSSAPRYTGRIEVILDHLVIGELWGFEVAILSDGRWTAELSTDRGDGYCRASAATPALALCAASLRARAA